ncbi:MAG: CCA tRNA nucleotidyltransferase [Ruminococcaceae bacterium]|nr:CCA tRNA nucleotidyltransferase [Oscillospiraceae bacterium]
MEAKNIKINIPSAATDLINKLYDAGYEAFIVGGCVRDSLLGRLPGDFDITTNAEPEEVKRLFKKTVDTGIRHGTVTVIESGEPYEVTTYRIDGEYADSRHPVSVSYTKNLRDDLARRDFTVNAMAYNDRVGLVDAFSGIDDLEHGILRAVGEARLRFTEDALRILRCIRFSSVLGFGIEKSTADALRELAPGLLKVSAERIYSEWKKLLGGKNAYYVIEEYRDVISIFLPELSDVSLPDRDSFDKLSVENRQLCMFASIGLEGFENASHRLKMESKTRTKGASVLKNLIYSPNPSDNELKRYLVDNGDEISLDGAEISAAVGITDKQTYLRMLSLVSSPIPRKISDLSIGGRELMAMGVRGEGIGKLLYALLLEVAQGNIRNDTDELLLRAQELL